MFPALKYTESRVTYAPQINLYAQITGAFAMNRPLQKKVQSAYADVQKAVKAKDAAALKSAWATYFKYVLTKKKTALLMVVRG